MWVVPDESGITPGYQQLEIDDELLRGKLVTIASGMPEHADDAAITISNRYAALRGARLQPGDSVELPQAPYLHLFVPRGEVVLEGAGPLHEGDAVRFTASGGQRVTATEPVRDPGLGDACGLGCGVSALRVGRRLIGVLLGGLLVEHRARPTRPAASPPSAGLAEVTVQVPDDLAARAVRRAAKGVGAQGLDDVGVGADPQAAAGRVGARRSACWCRCPAPVR